MKMKIYSSQFYLNLLFIVLLASCGETAQDKARIRPVKFESVAMTGGIQKRTFSGTSQSGSETNLSFRLNGLITMLDADIGDRVKKGKLLGTLDMKDIQLTYQKAKANVQSSEITMQNARSDLERTKRLYQSQSASLDDYEDAKTTFANAQSSYETATRELGLVESEFDYSRIKAPLSGVISDVKAEVNEFVQAGQAIIVMDAEDANIEVSVGIPENIISKITQGLKADVSISDTKVTGTVTEVGYSSIGSGVYPVIIKLDDNNNDLRPGMPASATFTFGSIDTEPTLTIPVYAVGEDETGNYVILLEESEDSSVYIAKKVGIQVGELTNDGFKVISGVSEGKKIATGGLHILLDGQRVKLLDQR